MSPPLSALVDLEQARRQFIVNQLGPQGVTQGVIAGAFTKVPRETFLEAPLQSRAYFDEDLYLSSSKRSLLSPRKLGRLFQAANCKPSEKILIIGFATGYSLAIAYEMGLRVYGVEENPLLYSFAFTSLQTYAENFYEMRNLENLLIIEDNTHCEGLPEHGPYDIILVEGGVRELPKVILEQLRPTGRLVCIYEKEPYGIRSIEASGFERVAYFETAHVLPGFEWEKAFVL